MEEDIIRRGMYGDREALQQIHTVYHQEIAFMVSQNFYSKTVADKIVLKIFQCIDKNIQNLQSPDNLHIWILKVVYQECFLIAKNNNMLDGNTENEQEVNHSKRKHIDIHQVIRKKIDSLDFISQNIAYLEFFERLSFQEIAFIVDIAKDDVEERIKSIIITLQNELTRLGIEAQLYLTKENLHDIYIPDHKQTVLLQQKEHSSLKKNILIGIAVIVLGSAIGYTAFEYVSRANQRISTIESIEFDPTLTKRDVPLKITLSNKNYDKVLINGEEKTNINENGQYTVQLMKDDKIIDSKEIKINNIDKTAPELVLTEDLNEQMLIYIKEDSGINEKSIEYYLNEIKSNDYVYDKDNQTIMISYAEGGVHTIYVTDKAGNKAKFELTF